MPFLPTEYRELSLAEAKQICRRRYREQRRSIDSDTRILLDRSLCENTIALPSFREADTVLAFYPVSGEPNILPILERAAQMGKKLAFPVCDPRNATMTFRLASIAELSPSTYGIPEPPQNAPVVTDFSNCFCIVPGIVFDQNGFRIGYGKGYYDRFLEHFRGVTAGLVYHELLVDSLPHEPTDINVSIIITERGVLFPNEKN